MGLSAWGWDAEWDAALSRLGEPDLRPGRVTTQERTLWTVQTEAGPRDARVRPSLHRTVKAVVGDWAVLRASPDAEAWWIEAVLPRRTQFSRKAAGSGTLEQVVASNVDTVWVVHGLDRPPNPRQLERYLALAWESGAQPAVILTKADVAANAEEARRLVEGIAFGVPVHVVSVERPDLLDALGGTLEASRTVALLGPSGVGKSSLVNALAGHRLLETGDVRESDQKGRHTTTRRQLVRLAGGSLLLDTPGMRELGVWDLGEGLTQAFAELQELAANCRFRDCTHATEPGCAVLEAVADGRLDAERLEGYRKLEAEAAYVRRKTDPRARARAVSEFKSIMKTLRHHPKFRARE